ncbi:hypothetical protein A6V39_00525 [Candidatus Mycoplasma haematobovis]|uniref:Uncharacterized protein n=1 Tax=Candidatus Mycoplasma haematobovis TaxID=432608 RepID=A0A1A9QEZ5_9MOLU|nr:hypothetical protein [Candidatus Mycoplasma haematobovis]OAL10535.1 hypothetical protein A6V39_00525 [Candidatus Mycoplasma haematobovis]
MTTSLKIGLGATIGTGVVGGTAGISYVLSQPKNLKEDLERGEHKPLNIKGDDASWKALVDKYIADPQTGGVGKIKNLNIVAPTPPETQPHPGIKQLRDQCEKLFKKTNKDKDYQQAKIDATNWCTNKNISVTA